MLNIPSFYPTPALLASKMLSKIKGYPTRWLEPSAGKGDLAEQIRTRYKSSYGSQAQIFCIEKDNDLQATLRGKGFTLLDSDFLTYSAPDQFDAILMNPPFESGENHLLKAIEIMYRGQIVCLLNAETIRHPFTNNRRRRQQGIVDLLRLRLLQEGDDSPDIPKREYPASLQRHRLQGKGLVAGRLRGQTLRAAERAGA
jgi:hypothetical protein